MLIPSTRLDNLKVLSVRSGTPVANITQPIINPRNLKIEGFWVRAGFARDKLVLLAQDIRDLVPNGFIVNDHEVLVPPTDLVRLDETLRLNFSLEGKPVFSGKKMLGKVQSYAFEKDSFFVIKLYVGRSLWRSFTSSQLTIDRQDIVEITPKRIIIIDNYVRSKATLLQPETATNYASSSMSANSSLTSE